jgi:hypothetical protein
MYNPYYSDDEEEEWNIEDPEEKEKFVEKLNESLDMFRRFKNYN